MNGTNNQNTNNLLINNEYVFRTNAISTTGDEFDPNCDEWNLDTVMGVVRFEPLREVATEQFVFNTKKTLRMVFETGNSNTARTLMDRLTHFVIAIQNPEINLILEQETTAYLMRNNNLRYLHHIKMLANKSHAIKAPLFSVEAHSLINNIKLADSDKDGSAIRAWNPIKGSLRPAEDQAVSDAINNAFNDGEINLRNYLAIRMFRGLGLRPQSLAYMKVCDIRDTVQGMTIRVPKAKQRGQGPRTDFMPWKPVTEGLARIIRLYINSEIKTQFGIDIENVPLFGLRSYKSQREYDTSIQGHILPNTISKLYRNNVEKLKIISPITGEQLVLNPRRERHTFATQLAMNGATANEIAINLGHAFNRSCEAYIDATIDHFQSLERHVGKHFIPIADRFLGKVVKSANDTTEFELYNDDFEGVGSCSSGGCEAVESGVAPQACYVCRKFNAWFDGPHEELLQMTVHEQQKLLDEGHAVVAETKTNIIIAITDLIEAIRQKKDAP